MKEKIIKKVSNDNGTPFYLFDEDEFVKNYKHLEYSFRSIYPNYHIAYSYKTNYMPYVCKKVFELGGYAEVVSAMEYHLAKKIGYSNEKIILNVPDKGEILEEHILHGGIINVDSIYEAEQICKIANNNRDNILKIGIRVNADVGTGFVSRFGICVEDGSISQVFDLLKTQKNIKVVGLHCHISRARGLEAWKRRIVNLIGVADKFFDGNPEYIDVGSGMYADMNPTLKAQFDNVPTYLEYAEAVAGIMYKRYGDSESMPILFSEPGTTVISRYMSLITSVVQTKHINEKTFATVDASFDNVGAICRMKKLPYNVISMNFDRTYAVEKPDIVGYTCLEQDCLYRELPESIAPEDIIEFENVGGYSIVNKAPFIRPNCPVYCFSSDGKVEVIKRKETFDDVFSTYQF